MSHWRNKVTLFALVAILFLCFDVADLRRFRFRSRYRSSSWRTRSVSKPRRPKGHFGKGGMKTFGKVVLATYIAKQMTPSVGFHPHLVYGKHHRPIFCQHCVSVNGSDPICEIGSRDANVTTQWCLTNKRSRPYCSTEYGITSDDVRFVRRSCNERRCNTCSRHLSEVKNSTKRCHTMQCDICNWDGCNSQSVVETFHDKWTGCVMDSTDQRTTFTDDDTCSGSSLSKNVLLVITTGWVAHAMAKF